MDKELKARISVRVHSQAKRSRITGMMGTAYKLDIAASPVDGKANDECVGFLSLLVAIPRSRIRIVSGAANRIKLLEFEGISMQDLQRKLNGAQ